MSYSHPIWNDVTACNYQSNKSWGSRDTMSLSQKVGSSASNSHDFVDVSTTRRTRNNPETGEQEMVFRFYVDGVCLKEKVFSVSLHGTAAEPIRSRSKMKRLRSL